MIDWLDGVDADDKLFLWVHYYDPHRDYRPPESFLEKATPPNRKARTAFKDFILEEHHLDLTNTPRLSKVIRQTIQYDAEVMYADASIQRLFEAFSQRDLNDNTLWVITADHGQGLWNHGNPGHHWQVYNTLLHVPLVFYYSGGSLAAGRIDDRLVEHVDIPITILDLLGAKLGEQAAEVQGESLAPLLHSRPMPSSSNYAFSVRRAPLRKDSGSDKPLAKKESGEKYALQDFRHKYIWWSDGPNEFFDLAADPYETHNLVAQPSADRDRLEAMLLDTVQRLASSKEAGVVSEQTLRGLEALGYTD